MAEAPHHLLTLMVREKRGPALPIGISPPICKRYHDEEVNLLELDKDRRAWEFFPFTTEYFGLE